MDHSTLTAAEINTMDYNQLIGLVKETNRPPGGYRSIAKIAQFAFLDETSRVLEIGTSTGVTAIELAKMVGCHIDAIDINSVSIAEAKARAEAEGVDHLINFQVMDATRTDFADSTFDMVFCGNVTSLIASREAAFEEYVRVLRPGGFLAAIPMYYTVKPSDELLDAVREAIQVDIIPWDRAFWLKFFASDQLERCLLEDYQFDEQPVRVVEEFNELILSRPDLQTLTPDASAMLQRKYREFMLLFRDNLAHMGFTIMMLRKSGFAAEPELFTSHLVDGAHANRYEYSGA